MSHGKTYAYGRTSSEDQSLGVQVATLQAVDPNVIILSEQASGASRDGRPKLALLMEVVGRGDRVVVTKLDRLSRDTVDMLEIVREIGRRGAGFTSLAEAWACFEPATGAKGLNPMVELIITVMGGVAQFERARIRERQTAGIEAAKRNGVYKGGKRRFDPGAIRAMHNDGKRVCEIARSLGCSADTVGRALLASRASPGSASAA